MLLVLALLLMPLPIQAALCAGKLTTLAAAHDCYRPLLLFAPSAADPELREEIEELRRHDAELMDRDIAVAIILPAGAERPSDLPFAQLNAEDEAAARRNFHQDEARFAVVLVGKDGGEKLQRSSVLTVSDLSHKVDGMPMRQQEMQQRR